MKQPDSTTGNRDQLHRRRFLSLGAASLAGSTLAASNARSQDTTNETVVRPPENKRLLLSCKLGMITKKLQGKALSLADRLSLAGEAGFDGVDLDQAGNHTPEEARDAVRKSRVFVHNAINHAHWQQRLTSSKEEERAQGRANIEHCIRVSHAAGGNGVLIVVGRATDGPPEVVEERCRQEIKQLIPLAASLGQPILIENVWNQMFYDHLEDPAPPEQTADRFVQFIDSFHSPWVGMYYDIGNHWKYGRPGEWIRALGHRCVKLDVKGFSRAQNDFTDIGEGDLPWSEVREALDEIGFAGWATAETGGGDLKRLTLVRQQMQTAFGL
jgi:hexulose-6-phosphate isomerase